MSDDEDAPMREKDPKPNELSSTSDDDDSSSSSSGSSSSSDSSDSESDGEGQQGPRGGDAHAAEDEASSRKYSIESVASSNGRARGAAGEPLADVNSNRAAARFREQNSEVGLMALGTKKRDRRTIEEIQRDLQKRRGRSGMGSSSNGASSSGGSKPPVAAARASPPKGSPALSPEPAGSDSSQIATGLPQIKMPKGKPNSARSRLTMKILGRGRPNPVPAPKAAATKKPSTGMASSSAPSSSSGPGIGAGGSSGIVTNISAGAKVVKLSSSSSSNDLDSYVAEQKAAEQTRQLEPKIEPKVIEWKPDGKVVRAILRGMLRFGDLTEVQMYRSSREAFADEYKLPNFVVRSNLPALTKVPEERLAKTACEIAERAQKALEDKQDSMKFVDVETKPSQVIERLYENLKLRVAVQRALRDARCSKSDDKGAYVLVAKQADLPTLGISRDFPPWHWAEKEHDWTSKKDAALLLGIYLHGFGAWEYILNDDLLHFHQQRALKGDRMKKRAENLLKRLPPPDESGEPRVVQLANAMIASSLNANQSIGAQLSKIINSSGNSNNVASSSNSSSSNAISNTGWQRRAEERYAARQNSNSSSSADAKAAVEDSIRRSNTQGSGSSSSNSSLERHRKPSITSSESASTSTAPATVAAVATRVVDMEPEEGEVNASRASSSKQPSTSSSSSSTSSKPRLSAKRSPSAERAEERRSEPSSAAKKKKSSKRSSSERSSRKAKKPRLLSKKECVEKWEPSVLLKGIRQVLKKMKIMASWSKEQKDEVIVEKVYKYIATIGEAIDEIVRRAEEKDGKQPDPHEWDELCSCLWSYAAGFTPFSATHFERLYDDICADGDSLRQAGSRRAEAST